MLDGFTRGMSLTGPSCEQSELVGGIRRLYQPSLTITKRAVTNAVDPLLL
jgi:hypothetical protein